MHVSLWLLVSVCSCHYPCKLLRGPAESPRYRAEVTPSRRSDVPWLIEKSLIYSTLDSLLFGGILSSRHYVANAEDRRLTRDEPTAHGK